MPLKLSMLWSTTLRKLLQQWHQKGSFFLWQREVDFGLIHFSNCMQLQLITPRIWLISTFPIGAHQCWIDSSNLWCPRRGEFLADVAFARVSKRVSVTRLGLYSRAKQLHWIQDTGRVQSWSIKCLRYYKHLAWYECMILRYWSWICTTGMCMWHIRDDCPLLHVVTISRY